MSITNCEWSFTGGSSYVHLNISGGKFNCLNMIINPFSISGLRLFVCNSGNSILENCVELQILGASSTGNTLIQLNTGTSTFKDSVFFFF
jgi:hypothetical protein